MWAKFHLLLLCTFLLYLNVPYAETKLTEGTLFVSTFNYQSWKYLTKFSYTFGSGEFKVRFKLIYPKGTHEKKRMPLDFNVYLDDNWPSVQKAKTCDSKVSNSLINITIDIPGDGSWSQPQEGVLTQTRRPHVWFFGISDCNKAFESLGKMSNIKIGYEVHMTNADKSEFPLEEQGFFIPYFVMVVYLAIFLVLNLNKLRVFYRKEEELDWAYLFLILSNFLQFWSVLFTFINYWMYSKDGKGLYFFQFIAQSSSVFSQYIMTCLLVLIASGWTILHMDLWSFEIFLPVSIMIGVFKFMIVILSQVSSDDSSKFHEYDNWAGWVIFFIQIGFYGAMLYGLNNTFAKARQKVLGFIHKFRIVASGYMLAFPIFVIISLFAAQYVRHKIIVIGTTLAHTLALTILGYLFSNAKSDYSSVSFRGQPILPTEKKD